MKHKSLVLVLAVVVSLLLTSFPMAQNINNDIFAENQTYDANLNAWTEQELSADVVDLEPLREKYPAQAGDGCTIREITDLNDLRTLGLLGETNFTAPLPLTPDDDRHVDPDEQIDVLIILDAPTLLEQNIGIELGKELDPVAYQRALTLCKHHQESFLRTLPRTISKRGNMEIQRR
ncbi:MAG: hypothetical protein ACOYH4_05415 [Saccharofermentanales bacterium]|jgi:hypothetical protein